MKHLLLLVLLFGTTALLANPMIFRMLSEYWFDTEGDMFVELSCNDHSPHNTTLRFGDGTHLLELPQPMTIPGDPEAFYFNLSQALPGLNLDRLGGQLTVEYEYAENEFSPVGEANWEGGNAPVSGKSLVAVYDTSGEGYDPSDVWTWEVPPTPGSSPFHTIARGSLNVTCTNQFGNPVPKARVNVISRYSDSGVTDAEGVFSTSCICHSINIQVIHPQTNEMAYQQVHNFFPGNTVNIQVNMTVTGNDDPTLPAAPLKGLEAFPNPFIKRQHDKISLVFDGSKEVLNGADVRIYNLRGQVVAIIPMHASEENNWIPERDLPSGIYLLKLTKNNQNYGTYTIRILK